MPTLDWIGKSAVVDHHRKVPYDGNICTLFEPEELNEFDWNLDSCRVKVTESEFSTELH